MKTITVNASKTYDVIIGSGLISSLPTLLKNAKIDGKLAIVTDKTVHSLYGDKLILALLGYDYSLYVSEGGEECKSGAEFLNILEFLAENEFTRSDVVVAFGGGIIGDLAGFVASCYLRGVRFVQIPTTLLAMVDSSVGGKTAVNLKAGKNLAGAFCQPDLVVADTDVLSTLSTDDFKCGMGEIIKYGMIFDENLLDLIAKGMNDNSEEIIARCVDLKRIVVEKDEKDHGDRQFLNFGHTLAHAIEKQTNFAIPHGQAVAIGMRIITAIAVKRGICKAEVLTVLDNLLEKYGLPKSIDIDNATLYKTTTVDKKRKGNSITVVLPEHCGKAVLKKMKIDEWKEFITEA
ncbi:MAG: 3-dehydroquinate synthase [Clostridiales bacterium]|nr:3-dehydroquinate synthase [Clostridiales bacterium]